MIGTFHGGRPGWQLPTCTSPHGSIPGSDDHHRLLGREVCEYRIGGASRWAGRASDERRRLPPAAPERNVEQQMVFWPALTLLGFLVLTALVIAMGTQSTARYE